MGENQSDARHYYCNKQDAFNDSHELDVVADRPFLTVLVSSAPSLVTVYPSTHP
jgi:hypothetical protein